MIKIENTSIFNLVLGAIDIEPSMIGTTKLELLAEQKRHMGNYLRCLEVKAEIEKIDLDFTTEGLR